MIKNREERLNRDDIKNIKYQCRMGYIIPFFLILILNAALFVIASQNNLKYSESTMQILTFFAIVIPVFISYLMNRKYKTDIRNGVKHCFEKELSKKYIKTVTEAGSGATGIGMKMKKTEAYYIIVENTKYTIEEEIFNQIEDGDKLLFFYAPKSKYLINIEKRQV